MKAKIENTLIQLGFNPSLKGFAYIVYIVNYLFASDLLPSQVQVCNELYTRAAIFYDVRPQNVERCIRKSIESAHIEGIRRYTMPNSNFIGFVYYLVKNGESENVTS